MQCLTCQHENKPAARFCESCGATLARHCPSCGEELATQARFCAACGASLAAQPPRDAYTGAPAAASAPEGERRHLTVLFCDLVGSTEIAAQLDPEDWSALATAYQRTAADAVQRFGGHVAKYLGDGLMCFFGMPQAHEDDAERAVRAGLAIVEAVQALQTTVPAHPGASLRVRVGMHTGPVVVGPGAGEAPDVFGETPHVAARVQALAAPDTVLLTAATHRLVAGQFVVEERGAQRLKGIREPIELYRALHPSGVRGRLAARALGGLTPFVGRAPERRLLVERWEQARAGEGQVVLITGEAGIGKSRLVQTLKEHLAATPHTWIEGHSSVYHQHTPFHAVVDMLAQGVGWGPVASPAARIEALEQSLDLASVSRAAAVPLIAPLLGLPLPAHYPLLALSPEGQRKKLLAALSAWLVGLARVQPVVAVLEDLHWVDPSTLELQALVVEPAATAPLLILYTARPEFHLPWPLHGHHAVLTLNRLAPRQIRELIAGVAARVVLAPEVIETVVTRTDGVPLFAEELTKALLEARGPELGRPIPATLEDSLMARLDRLGPAKEVAQLGAVIGREFAYTLVRAVSPLSDAELHRALDRLTSAELLYARGTPPEATYVFKHALVQDAAYASLLKSQQRELHRLIAAALTERFADTAAAQPELVAHHHEEAGQADLAVTYYQQAGERATQRSANEEAVGHLRRALALVGTLPETRARHQRELGLQMAIAAPLAAARGISHPEYEQAYARARELTSQIGESPELPRVLAGMADAYLVKGDLATAAEVAQEALAAAERTGDAFDLLLAHFDVGGSLLYQGDFSRALQHLEHSIKLYNPSEHGSLAYTAVGLDRGVGAHSYAAWCHVYLGHPDRALALSEEALALAKRVEHPLSLASALFFAGFVHIQRGELDRMRERAGELVGLCERLGFPLYLETGRFLRGFARVESGEGEAGIAEMRQALVELARIGSGIGAPSTLCSLAEGLRKVGRHDDALGALARGVARAEEQGQHFYDAELHRLRAEILLDTDGNAVEEAEALLGQSLEIARRQEAKTFQLRAATSLARLWQRQGKRETSRALLAPLYAWFTEGFDTRDLKDAKALLEEL